MNQYVLITGASGGIGSAIAHRLAADGCSLFLHYNRNEEAIQKLIRELPTHIEAYAVQADLSAKGGAEQIRNALHKNVDGIVYTAGKSIFGLMTDVTDEQLEEMTNLQITNLYKLVQYTLPSMVYRKQGNIVVISSIWGQTGASCEVLYSMLKGAQNTFVKALAKEVAPSGIRVNAIAPGAVETDMLRVFSKEEKEGIADEIPLGRIGSTEEIAEAASFLLSPKSSYITGQVLGVNGGWLC